MLVRRVRPVTPRLDGAPFDFNAGPRELFRSFGAHGGFAGASAGAFPRMNITQDADNLYLHAELPGVDPDQLSISALRNSVSLAGKRRLIADPSLLERGDCALDCTFDYTVALPADVDAERMDAGYCDGVLALTLPKAQRAALES